jgi:branched-chain amino acid transport system substrate-binding protein
MKRNLFWLAVPAILSTALAACGSGGSSSAAPSASPSKPVSVLVITDLSGADKAFGTQQALGIQAAAAYYNAHGGILGRQVSVTVDNDNADASTAVSELVKATTTSPGKYSMIWGGEEGSIIAALIPVIARYKILAMAINDGSGICATASKCPTEFALSGNSSLFPVGAAQYLKGKGYTNVGLISTQLDFTQAEVSAMSADLAKEGIKSESVSFPLSAVSVTPEMSRLKSAGVQAVYAAAFGASSGYVLNARSSLGWNVPVVFDVGGSSFDLTKLASAAQLTGVFEAPFFCMNPANKIPGWTLLNKYAPTPPVGATPCNQVGIGWDAMVSFANAAAKAGSLGSPALVSGMESLNETAAQSDMVTYQKYCWSSADHENLCNQASDWAITPVGPIVNGRLQEAS